jgi:hypothetical protein
MLREIAKRTFGAPATRATNLNRQAAGQPAPVRIERRRSPRGQFRFAG